MTEKKYKICIQMLENTLNYRNVLKQELEDFLNDFCHQMLMKEVQ